MKRHFTDLIVINSTRGLKLSMHDYIDVRQSLSKKCGFHYFIDEDGKLESYISEKDIGDMYHKTDTHSVYVLYTEHNELFEETVVKLIDYLKLLYPHARIGSETLNVKTLFNKLEYMP